MIRHLLGFRRCGLCGCWRHRDRIADHWHVDHADEVRS